MKRFLPWTVLLCPLVACSGSDEDSSLGAAGAAGEMSGEGDVTPHLSLAAEQKFEIALRFLRAGQPQAAVEHLDSAIEDVIDDPRLYDARATVRMELGQVSQGLADAEKAVALAPDDPMYLVNRGQFYRSFHRDSEAREDFDRALALDAGYHAALFNRGTLSYAEGKFSIAEADFVTATELAPEIPNYWFNRAVAHEATGDFASAREAMMGFLERARTEDEQQLGHALMKRWSQEPGPEPESEPAPEEQ